MANSVFRPTEPHFFQPILPNSHTHLTIPEAFFFRYLEEKKPRSAVLRSNGGERSLRVKINGRNITNGWKDFVSSHDLRVGDIVLFRLERRMVFHVTVFCSSGCEKQNAPFNGIKQEEETSKDSKKRKTKKRSRSNRAAYDKSSFVATVTLTGVQEDRMFVLRNFARLSGLDKTSGTILLMNAHKRIWKSRLGKRPDGAVYSRGGWKDFCSENNLEVGDLYGFKLSWNARTPIFTLMDSDELLEASRRFLKTNGETTRSTRRVACSASQGLRFLTLTVSSYVFKRGRQLIPMWFARLNGLNRGHEEITVMDKNGFCRVINLSREKSTNRVYFARGWKSFCVSNGVKKGDSVRLELVPGKKLTMKFLSKVKTE